MLTYAYHSNNDDVSNWVTLRTFSKKHPLLDNEHVRQDGDLGLGQDGLGPSYPNPLNNTFWLSMTKLFLVLFKYWYGDKACWNVIRCTEYNSMLSKLYGCIIIFLVYQSWWSSYTRCALSLNLTYRPFVWHKFECCTTVVTAVLVICCTRHTGQMAHEIWLCMLVHMPIGWCAKIGVTVIWVRATTVVIS